MSREDMVYEYLKLVQLKMGEWFNIPNYAISDGARIPKTTVTKALKDLEAKKRIKLKYKTVSPQCGAIHKYHLLKGRSKL